MSARSHAPQEELWEELPLGSPVTELVSKRLPNYSTHWGAAYAGDGLAWLCDLPDKCVGLVVTSPPYALEFKKEYGNVAKRKYVGMAKAIWL